MIGISRGIGLYILPESIKRRLLRRYRRRSREVVVDERYRGWAWELPPLDPPYDFQLPLSEIAGRYCESMRDIYIRHVLKIPKPTNCKMIEGGLYHKVIAKVIEQSKRTLYIHGRLSGHEFGAQMTQLRDKILTDMLESIKQIEVKDRKFSLNYEELLKNSEWLWNYQVNQIVVEIDRVLAENMYIGLDSLVSSVIPVVVEQRLDGRNLGLSGYLSADAYGVEGVVLDVKTGTKRWFHRLATTGYAMVIESIHEYPVDIGCIIYCQFGRELPPKIVYDIHTIDEPVRQEFLEHRDQAMRMLFEERDPGLPEKCYEDCPYWDVCH